jgi:hypothetical protein
MTLTALSRSSLTKIHGGNHEDNIVVKIDPRKRLQTLSLPAYLAIFDLCVNRMSYF